MGILMGALAGAGKAAGEIADANIKLWGQQELQQQQAQLTQAKEEAMARLNNQLSEQRTISAETRAQEPLKRFGGLLSANQNAEVPMTAAPVTNLSGQGEKSQGGAAQGTGPLDGVGFKGDPEKIRKMILALPDSQDKTNALQQLDSQLATDTETAKQGILGKTRKMTGDEALSKTREEALASDPVALAAYEKTIGESSRKYKREDRLDTRDERSADTAEKRADQQITHQNAALEETIRHNKALEKVASEKTGAEKLSPAAKVQLDIASTGLASAQKEETLAAKAYSEASKGMDPEAAARAKADWASAKSGVAMAMKHYTAVGKAHLGDEWKEIAMPEIARPEPPQAAIDRLLKNPEKKADFDQLFGPGSADKYLNMSAPAGGKKSAPVDVGRMVDEDGIPIPAGQRELPTPYGVPSIKPYQGKSVTTPFNPK